MELLRGAEGLAAFSLQATASGQLWLPQDRAWTSILVHEWSRRVVANGRGSGAVWHPRILETRRGG